MLRATLRSVLPLFLLTAQLACGVATLPVEGADEGMGESQDELSLSRGRFETFVGADRRYYFHLLAGNGQKVLASQGYASAGGAQGGIESVQANGKDEARFRVSEAKNGEWYFTLVAGNGAVIGRSELYASQSNAERGLATVARIINYTVENQPAPEGSRFQVFKGLDGQYYFHVRADNGEIVLQSQSYASRSGATGGTASVQRYGIDAARYELIESTDAQYYFVLRATNNQVIGRGETYASKSNAQRGVNTVIELLSGQLSATN